MGMTERIVVLMTQQQKQYVRLRAAAERMSMSDYMRHRALDERELLSSMLDELATSTTRAAASIDLTLARLEASEQSLPEIEAAARRHAMAKFSALDPDLFAQITGQGRSA